jgi:hypothetical protein
VSCSHLAQPTLVEEELGQRLVELLVQQVQSWRPQLVHSLNSVTGYQ